MCIYFFTLTLLTLFKPVMSKKETIDQYVIDKIKEIRISKKISQAELARLLDVSEGFIGNIENKNYRAKYNLKHLNELAIIFKCSPKDFMPEKALK